MKNLSPHLLHNSNEHSVDLKKSRVWGCDEKPEQRDRLPAAKFFGDPVSSRKLVRAKDTRAGCDRKKKKKILAQKSLDLFERIYDETGCARSKDRRRKSEKQISIMRALFSTMKTKLEEAIEMEVSLNFKLNRSRRLRFSSLPNRPVMIFVIL